MGKERVSKAFLWIFCGVFALVFVKVLFGDSYHNYHTVVLLLYTLLSFGIILLIQRVLSGYKEVLTRYYKFILIGFAAVYFIAVTAIGFHLRFTPAWDMGAIYDGAIQWLQEGSFYDYYDYYGYFPNNLGGMTVLHAVFAIASLFGVRDFFAAGIIFNSMLITATALLTSLTCVKLMDRVMGTMALIFFALQLPFLFMGAAFYTDSLSLPYPILFYYLYLCFKEQTTRRGRIACAVGMALALAVGSMVKFIVLIVLIAVLIDASFWAKGKDLLLIAGSSLLAVALVLGGMNAYMYRVHLDRDTCEELKTPYLHWVMMGMTGDGCYNSEDYEYTNSFPAAQRGEACLRRLTERVGQLKVSGVSQLFLTKSAVAFGDGTFALSDFLDDTPAQHNWLHDHILYGGEHYSQYKHMTTGLLLALYLLMILGALPKGDGAVDRTLAPRLAGLGILAFLLLWEVSGRYFTSFVPLLDLCGMLGLWRLAQLREAAVAERSGVKHSRKTRRRS